MQGRLAVGCCIVSLTLLGFVTIPGHTFLHSDTQIYVPMLEHIWDPSTFPRDLIATKPHLSYTLYDEIAIALRWLTRTSFETVLIAEQFLFRALQILGIYLLARSLPLSRAMALLVAAISSLGATIVGPAVLTMEYEPIPRGFAIGLVVLAIGLAARERLMLASAAASIAFLFHAPTTFPFWIVFGLLLLRRREYRAFGPLACAVLIVFAASRLQTGVAEKQAFFFRIDPEFETLQRMRASYNWVSNWIDPLIWQYLFYWLAGLAAFWRVRPRCGRAFALGLPLIGILSLPASYLLLDRIRWGFIPQFQPARALLFVTLFTSVLSAAAGIRAAEARKFPEALVWFALVFAIPMQARITTLAPRQIVLAIGLAAVAVTAVYLQRWSSALLVPVVLAASILLPTIGGVRNYPHLEDADIDDLARFGRERTPKNAMFLFANAGKGLYPGIFRARALRSVYVDWKSGGQVNYYRSLGEEWWSRWKEVNGLEFRRPDFDRLRALGIDYVVLTSAQRLPDRQPVYENSRFVVYAN
jgi:hypothetical protein